MVEGEQDLISATATSRTPGLLLFLLQAETAEHHLEDKMRTRAHRDEATATDATLAQELGAPVHHHRHHHRLEVLLSLLRPNSSRSTRLSSVMRYDKLPLQDSLEPSSTSVVDRTHPIVARCLPRTSEPTTLALPLPRFISSTSSSRSACSVSHPTNGSRRLLARSLKCRPPTMSSATSPRTTARATKTITLASAIASSSVTRQRRLRWPKTVNWPRPS